jgi:hypothetical protein
MADGTAPQCGRVGSRHSYLKPLSINDKGFFIVLLKSGVSQGKAGVLFCNLFRKKVKKVFERVGIVL